MPRVHGVEWGGGGGDGGEREEGELAAGTDAEQFGEGETVCCTHPWREHGGSCYRVLGFWNELLLALLSPVSVKCKMHGMLHACPPA